MKNKNQFNIWFAGNHYCCQKNHPWSIDEWEKWKKESPAGANYLIFDSVDDVPSWIFNKMPEFYIQLFEIERC